jgi:hypothetical protein
MRVISSFMVWSRSTTNSKRQIRLLRRTKVHIVAYANMFIKYESQRLRIGGFRQVFGGSPPRSDSHPHHRGTNDNLIPEWVNQARQLAIIHVVHLILEGSPIQRQLW